MTGEYILRASVKAMEQGRRAHCFHAHVLGNGYVNDGTMVQDNAEYRKQLVHTAQSDLKNMDWAADYAEPGYEQPKHGIFFANWNHFPDKTTDLLEKAGYAIEWSDEWSTCDDCNRAFRTSHNSHAWTPAYKWVDECSLLCLECAKAAEPSSDDEEEE